MRNDMYYACVCVGPGEQGAAVILSAEEEKLKDELYKANGFNGYVSDKISLDRALKDIRHPEYVRRPAWWRSLLIHLNVRIYKCADT